MKPTPMLVFAGMALVLGAIPFVAGGKIVETQAEGSSYESTSVPITMDIDLNRVEETEVRAYYQDLNQLGPAERQGTNLLKHLKPILSSGQKYYDFDKDSANPIWRIFEISDRDWENSPASELPNYDAVTNKITKYRFLTDVNPYVHTLYRNPGVEAGRQRIKDNHGANNGIDREHIWPKCRGFGVMPDNTEYNGPGARGDLMHLWPGDHAVNSYFHRDYAYGFVDLTANYTDAGDKADYNPNGVMLAGNLKGLSSSLGGDKTVFEPQDCDKGDIARAVFYMAARYNNWADDDDTIDGGNPNLFLDDTMESGSNYSTPTNPVSVGILRDLLVWHRLDPVDDFEIYRNDLLYRNFTNNRNPFIDFPQWADYIWGTSTFDEDAHRTLSYDPTPTSSANLSLDVWHGYREIDPGQDSGESGSEEEPFSYDPSVYHEFRKSEDLYLDDVITLVYEPNDAALCGIRSKSGADKTIALDDHGYVDEEALALTVKKGVNEGTYALFSQDNGYLSAGAAGTELAFSGSLDAASSWTYAVSEGDFTFKNVSTNRSLLYSTAVSANPFRCYATASSNYRPLQVYRLNAPHIDAYRYAHDFLDVYTGGCTENDGYDPEHMDWGGARESFFLLPELAQKIILNQPNDGSLLGSLLARYDRVVSKYGTAAFPDFLSRKPSQAQQSGSVGIGLAHNPAFYLVLGVLACGLMATFILIVHVHKKEKTHEA